VLKGRNRLPSFDQSLIKQHPTLILVTSEPQGQCRGMSARQRPALGQLDEREGYPACSSDIAAVIRAAAVSAVQYTSETIIKRLGSLLCLRLNAKQWSLLINWLLRRNKRLHSAIGGRGNGYAAPYRFAAFNGPYHPCNPLHLETYSPVER